MFQTDSDYIESLIQNRENGIVVIPKRNLPDEPEREWWLIDRAILIPDQTVFVLQNCRIKLSDKCRDNFFRSANCGLGMGEPEPFSNIEIRGEGFVVLEGADHPRATGDGEKKLMCPAPIDLGHPEWGWGENYHMHTYGTDAGKEGESQLGGWRNIGILLANVHGFKITGLKIVESHAWAISLEACTNGEVRHIEFDMSMERMIDGELHNIENQDGLDIRNGCSDIMISDITGRTGDDVIALTAIATPGERVSPGGLPGGDTHVMHGDWTCRESGIRNIIIRNVLAHSAGCGGMPEGCGCCAIIRLLACHTTIQNVIIDNVVDTSPGNFHSRAAVLLGESDGAYGKCLPDSISNISISNIVSNNRDPILNNAYLSNSTISNVINRNPGGPVITVLREGGMKNVLCSNIGETKTE